MKYKQLSLKIFSTLVIISLLSQFNSVLADNNESRQDETNNENQGSMHFYELNTSKSGDIISAEYGDNVKYEYLSNWLTRAALPFPTVYNEYSDEWEPVNLNLEWNDVLSSWSAEKTRQEIFFSDSSTADKLFKVKDDDEWKATLDRGHLIIGWVSSGPADGADSIIENFLVHINDGNSIYISWQKATRNSGWSGTAGIIANNKMAIYDRLWGQGPVTPDEFICDTNAYRFSWATPQ